MTENRVFLLDGHALAYRAYFAFINANLRNSENIPTGPILGFANTLVRLIESENPTHLAVAWDTHAPTFRHKWDSNYKANRPPQPDDLRVTIPLMKELVDKFGFQNLEKDGYEADDIIGTLAFKAGVDGASVFMVTPDKDFMQLVTDRVKMLKPLNNGDGFSVVDISGVEDYFGVPPEKVIDVLAIIGDTSDNIPGVPGIGKKGAPSLIQEYGSLEAALNDAVNIKSKRVREGLINNRDQALLSRKMIVINTEVPETPDWQALKWEGPNTQLLVEFFKRMEFRTLTKKFDGKSSEEVEDKTSPQTNQVRKPADFGQGDLFGMGHAISVPEAASSSYNSETVTYELVKDEAQLIKIAKTLMNAAAFSFDTETTDTDAISAELLGIALCAEQGKACYVVVDQSGEQGTPIEKIREILGDVFQSKAIKVAHNFKYDYTMLKRYGFEIQGPTFDTMIAGYLIDSNQKLSMDELSKTYLNYEPISIKTLIGTGRNQKSMRDVPIDQIVPYACEDADITYQLFEVLREKLHKDELNSIAEELEFPLIAVLAEMELAGISLNTNVLNNLSKQLGQDILAKEALIYKLAGEKFNINSPAQLSTILFEKMKLPAGKKTKSGNYSTDEQVMNDLAINHEFPAQVLDYRSLAKLKSTYVDALPKLINGSTNRVHTSFNQHITATGRLSSSGPNLQNIPIRTERGREIRKAFKAREGCMLIAVDYSQIELRVIASISGDEAMIEAFKNGEDIHARTAREIFGLESFDQVDREMRRKAKEVNFGIPYGVSAFGLAQRLGISRTEAKAIIDAYFNRFPAIKTYINDSVQFASQHGFVKTLSGRRRYIPDIRSSNPSIRGFAERTAINMPIQGTAADLIKMAMIKLHNIFIEKQLKTIMVLQVHDELLFEVPENEKDEVIPLIRTTMEQAMELKVPLKVELGTGMDWYHAH